VAESLKRRGVETVITDKQPVPASRFVQENLAWRSLAHRRCIVVIAHTRWGTHGKSDDPRNLHPFSDAKRSLFMVHNGVVSNHLELAEKHQLRLLGECDSESLLGVIARHADVSAGLGTCLREVKGSMAVALYDHANGQVWLARNNGNPLWIMRFRNEHRTFFASTAEILLKAVEDAGLTRSSIDMLFPLAAFSPTLLTTSGRMRAG
jgi:glucosamine 6-phosphate synthetase-like amidotransferase/phosphosugar isomerase protein